MGHLLKTAVRLTSGAIQRSFDQDAAAPEQAQLNLLRRILHANRKTRYGRQYGFARISDADAYAAAVPLVTFEDLADDARRMRAGEPDVLTAGRPVMFTLTSGTTATPKYVPLTRAGMRASARASRLWLVRALQDHPDFLDGAVLCIAGAAVEATTPSGIPAGSASGMMYRALPRALHRSFVLPFMLSEIQDYAVRYRVMARLACERNPSFVVTPNPSTLIKLAETCVREQEAIIRAINDGEILSPLPANGAPDDRRILDALRQRLRPNPRRARVLEQAAGRGDGLLPSACWSRLRLIGCWLGGSAGFQAARLAQWYGATIPLRDIGYLASEGTMTIPSSDNTATGVLALHNHFYEFIPSETSGTDRAATRPLRCHELQCGRQYRIILTGWNGLYRYDINDLVTVHGYHKQTPVIAFDRKGDDMFNLTGEKLHVNHVIAAFRMLEEAHGIAATQFRVTPDATQDRYRIFMQPGDAAPPGLTFRRIATLLDSALSACNIEYAAKRKSGRLRPPMLHVMGSDWAADVQRRSIPAGRRDSQYKWRVMEPSSSGMDQAHMRCTINPEEEKDG